MPANHSNNIFRFQSVFEALEDRVLFDGVPDATFVLPQAEAAESVPAQVQNLHQADIDMPRELIVVDPGVENSDALLSEILEKHGDSAFEIRMLDADSDGVEQITDLLAAANGKYDAIHVISHGEEGQINLGNTQLTTDSISGYADQLASWSSALTDDADILFYGCDLAGNAEGEEFIESISAITGADVAASDDLTGAAELGGDWDLELNVGEVQTAALSATSFAGVLAAPVAAADGPVAVAGNVAQNIDVLGNDVDADGDALAVTAIVDIQDGDNVLSFAGAGSSVTLASGTVVELQADGTLNVTTTPLGFGPETFDYIVTANGETAQATVSLDRSQGELVIPGADVVDIENSTNLAVGGTLAPVILGGEGLLPNVIGTDVGFRAANAGAVATDFTIPEGTTSIRITSFGGNDLGSRSNTSEDFQRTNISVDLLTGTYSGHTALQLGQDNPATDRYAFADVALGSPADGDPNLVSNPLNGLNTITVSAAGGVLSVLETQDDVDQAYLVEFMSGDQTSADFLGSASTFLELGVSTATVPDPGSSNYAVIVAQDGAGTTNIQNEDKGFSRIFVDLDTGLASGTVFAQSGDGTDLTAAYAFEGYDITSGVSVLNSGATILGDSSTTTNNANILHDFTISNDGTNLVVERSAGITSLYNTLITTEFYERVPETSAAAALGGSADFQVWDGTANPATNTFRLPIPEGAETGSFSFSANRNSDGTDLRNENTGSGDVFIDLENGTTSGSLVFLRVGEPDLVAWSDLPFGDRLLENIVGNGGGDQVVSNRTDLADTIDDLAVLFTWDVVTDPDGSQVLEVTLDAGRGETYGVLTQTNWFGRCEVEITADPTNGTFNVGSLNAATGLWEVDPADYAALTFTPNEGFFGDATTINVTYCGEEFETNVFIEPDTDNDGVADVDDADKDGDGILDTDEGAFPNFTNGDFSDRGAGFTTRGAIDYLALSGGPNEGDTVARLDNNRTTGSLTQVLGGAETTISELEFEFGWNNGTLSGGTAGQNIEIKVNGVTYLTIETPDDGGTDQDNATDLGGDARVTASNGASFLIEDPSVQGSQFIDASKFNEWTLRTITLTLPSDISSPVFSLESGPRPGNGEEVSDDFAVTAFTITEGFIEIDTDGDGVPDHCDLDSDNDGISDLVESGDAVAIAADTDGDGMISAAEADVAGLTDSDGDGAYDTLGNTPVDSDGDGVADYLDLDSDNDGIPDTVEAQTTAGYIPPTNMDTDGDGVDDAYDPDSGGQFSIPVDTDGDGTTDQLDTDSDNDGFSDSAESGLVLSGNDADGDGIDDAVNASYDNTDGDVGDPSNDLDNETGDTTEVGYREFAATIGAAKEITSGPTIQDDGTYALTYSVVIENTGNVTLNNLTVDENLLTQFGPAFDSATNLTLATAPSDAASTVTLATNWDGSGTTEIIDNSGTVTSLVAGDSFIVTFDVIINPTNSALDNQVSVSGTALDANGDPYTDALGNPIVVTDVSDSGSDPDGINGGENGDTGGSDDATPLHLPVIVLAKEVVSTTPNGDNFDVVYQLVVENTGNVDLTDISLVDDLATQFGNAFIGAGSLTFATAGAPPAGSSITLDAGWNGDGTDGIAEMVDQSVTTNVLKVGDSFVVQITVTVDPDATGTSGPLNNQATVGGDAVDDMGNPVTNAAGDPVVATDLSDSGSDPNGTNPGGDGDTGGSNDPTPLTIPDLRVAKQAHTVEEVAGLNGVFDVTYLVVIENTGTIELTDLQITDDVTALTNFGDAYDPSAITGPSDRSGLVAAPTIVANTLANSADLPTLNSAFVAGAGQTTIFDGTSGTLQVGEQITVSFTVRIDNDELLDGDAGTAPDPGNQVTGSANSAIGIVSDLSDDGLNPNNDNGEGTTDDPTPFEVPQIRLFKAQGDAVSNGDGTSTITVTLRVQNSGTVPLSDLSLTEDLADQFGDAFISTTVPTIDATLAPTSTIPSTLINSAWAGDTSQDLFDPAEMSELLNRGEEFSITFDVTIDPDLLDDNSDFLTNTADVTGVGENFDGSDITVSDQSGADNGDGLDTDEPTAAIVPEIAVAKAAGDAVANGENFDVTFTLVVENTGSVNLDSLTLFDDLAAEFGNALVSVSGLTVQNFAGSGTAPTANAAWEGDTSLSLFNDDGLLNPGDRFEVVFTTTIDPDGIDSVSQPLENQATVGGNAVDEMGNPLTNSAGDLLVASDDSDSGVSPQGTNPGENGDLGTSDDPTPIIIADIAAAKQVVGAPTRLANGNFSATYRVVVENTGTVDLANLTLSEDLATQLGAAFENASGLRLTTSPSDPSSSVTLDRVNWDGETFTEIVDSSQPSLLAVGDSFVFEFTVEVDAGEASGLLENTVTVGGDAVDV